jgi:hypothetical protein
MRWTKWTSKWWRSLERKSKIIIVLFWPILMWVMVGVGIGWCIMSVLDAASDMLDKGE